MNGLVLTPSSAQEAAAWLAPWEWLVGESYAPLFLNLFGCHFLERGGGVFLLDVFFGTVEPVAPGRSALAECLADAAWRETYLFAGAVDRLRAAGLATDAESCYALAPPPVAGGPDPWRDAIDPASVMVVPVATLQALASGAARAARNVSRT